MNEDHFDILLDRYLSGEIDRDGLEEFERSLLSDRRVRALFWRGVKLDAALSRLGGEAWGRLLAARGRRRRRMWLVPASAAAAVAVGALALWLARPRDPAQGAGSPGPAGAPPRPASVAVLREATAAVAAGGREFRSGQTIGPETVDLRNGSMLVTLFSGTRVALDAPARFACPDDASVELLAGALRAEVPAVAGRFALRLPGGRIETGTSRLAAWVGADGLAGLRLDAGEVVVRPAGGRDARRLGPGDYTLAADGAVTTGVDAAPGSGAPFPEPPAASPGERLQLAMREWQRASDARAGDGSLLVYLRFLASGELVTGLLINEGGHEAGSPEAVLVSGSWVEGRWPGKRALLLQSAADRVRFRVDGSYPQLTFCAWIQPWRFDNALNALVMSQWDIPGEVHWQFSQTGDLRFGIRPSGGGEDGLFHRVFAERLLPPGQRGSWYHLATSYDADTRAVIHYLNGLEVKRGTLPERIPLAFGHATIGNATNPPPDIWGPRSFGGAVDELAIYARALSQEEIRQLHREGAPNPLPQD